MWTQSPHGGENERGTIGRALPSGADADGQFVVEAHAPAGVAIGAGYIYWANYGNGTIGRARLDGSDVDQRFIRLWPYVSVIGVAVGGDHIYWAASTAGAIGRARLDGSDVERRFVKAGDSPTGLAVDGDYIYWAHRDVHDAKLGVFFTYAIGRASIDGSRIDPDFIRVSNAVDGVAVDGRYIFWSNAGEHAIGRANLDGTHIAQRCVAVRARPLENVPEGVAADARFVYWTNYPADSIARARTDGSDVRERLIRVKGVPEGVAVAAAGGRATSSPCRASPPPLLLGPRNQSQGTYATGWGEVAPAVISNGGAASSGTVFQIHWQSWGGAVAVGRGLHPEYAPHGGYYPKPLVAELRASVIRRCTARGRRVYTRYELREQVKPGGRMGPWFAWAANMCRGFR